MNTFAFCRNIHLRIDASGWGVNFDAVFHKVWLSCFPGL